jgi:hypothetical protein
MKKLKLAPCLLVAASCLTAAPSISAQSLPTKLVYQQDLVYQGSFTFQNTKSNCSQGSFDFEYVHGVTAFNPASNSIFVVGHGACQQVAEWTVPALGGVAQVRQTAIDVTGGKLGQINPQDPNSKAIGGLLVIGDRLVATGYSTYDGAASATSSHFVRSATLTNGSTTGPFRVGDRNPAFYGGHMTMIPTVWRSAFGGDVLTGQCCLSIISRTSFGPSVSAVSSGDLVSARNPTPATMLVGYPEGHLTLGPGTSQSDVFSLTSQPRGVVFPEGTNSVLFFGKHGTGPYCYGEGAACGDPADNSKGTHAYPYVPYVWAYRASDLADVKAGRKQPWDVVPYATFRLPSQVQTAQIGGATYDPSTGRLYIIENYGGSNNMPRAHVFTINGSTTAPTPTDTSSPTVSLTSPAANSTVNGTTTLAATASDNVGVTGVWFTVDGAAIGAEDTAAPYQASWNTASVANGTHTLRAIARDAAGNTTTSAPVTVTVSNAASDTTAPTVSLTAPAAGAAVSGTVAVTATAADNVGVTAVQFTLNGVNLGAPDTSAPYSVNWSTTGAANGTHTLRASARDAAGNETLSAARTVTVNNQSGSASDTARPSVSLSAPASGATVSGIVTVAATASDNVGVTAVQFTLDGANLGAADTTAPYTITWNTAGTSNGSHTLRAVARDAAGNTRTSSARTITVTNAGADTSAPTISLSAPAAGATVSGIVTVAASAADNVGIVSVQFMLNGVNLGAPDTTAPFAVNWNTTGAVNGGYLLRAIARDAAGNVTTSATRTVAVSNSSAPTPPPTLPSPSTCATPDPFVAIGGGTCYNGGWLPPGMTPPSTSAGPPPPAPSTPAAPSAPATCTTPQPGANWTCYNGGWLPPGMTPPASGGAAPPSTPATPPPAPTACTTAAPGTGWVCRDGGWLPPGYPGA